MDLFGIGPAGAARILSDVGDVTRFPDRNHFASWTGTAPLHAHRTTHHHTSTATPRRARSATFIDQLGRGVPLTAPQPPQPRLAVNSG
jgi:transposase